MKISKNLLKQIALGVCFAGAVVSCGIRDEDPLSDEKEICDKAGSDNGDTKHDWENCEACGKG